MGSIGASKNIASKATPAPEPPRKTLYSRDQADEFTKDYTPEMFVGDINNTWLGSGASLRDHAEMNAPDTLEIGGYTFEKMNNEIFRPTLDYEGKTMAKTVVKLEYQATEKVGNEYPILQVGIRAWRTKGGKVKSEIIRDGFTNKTRFL